jgi:hypothetical protein
VIVKGVGDEADAEFFINQVRAATAAVGQLVVHGKGDAVLTATEFFGGDHRRLSFGARHR